MIRICMYCERVLGEKEPFADNSETHGICDECLEKYLEDESMKEYNKKYEEYIVEKISSNPEEFGHPPFDKDKDIVEQKVNLFFNVFESEYGWRAKQYGESKALSQYLRGLPSVIDLPFTNHDILQLAEKFGSIEKDAPENRKDKILFNYWNFMATKLLKLKKKILQQKYRKEQ